MNDADRKAMQQAVEALESCLIHPNFDDNVAEAAIAALRTQIAAPEPFQPDWMNYQQGVVHGRAEAIEECAPSTDQAELVRLGLEAAAKACDKYAMNPSVNILCSAAVIRCEVAICNIDPADVLAMREAT